MSIYTTWLPFAEEACREEPKRFTAAASGLRHALGQCTSQDSAPGSWSLVLPWLEPIKRYIHTQWPTCAAVGHQYMFERPLAPAYSPHPCTSPPSRPSLCSHNAPVAPPFQLAASPASFTSTVHAHDPPIPPHPRPRPPPSLVSTKTEFDRGLVADVIRDLWEAILQSGDDVEVQVSSGKGLHNRTRPRA